MEDDSFWRRREFLLGVTTTSSDCPTSPFMHYTDVMFTDIYPNETNIISKIQRPRGDKIVRWCGIIGIIVLLIQLIRAPLFESFWLDELLTRWIITSPSLETTISRAQTFQAQSPLYFVILREWAALTGTSPLWLRLPSLFFCYGTLFWLTLLAKELRIKEPFVLVLIPFLSIDEILKSALSARPYSVALFFCTLSTLLMVRFVRRKTILSLVLSTVTLTVSFYLHYLFGGTLLIHCWWLFLQRRQLERRDLLLLTMSWVAILCTWLPGVTQIQEWSQRDLAIFLKAPPSFSLLLGELFPTKLLLLAASTFVSSWLFLPWSLKLYFPIRNFLFTLGWAWLPVLLAFLASHYFGHSLLIDRYFLWYGGGISLLFAALVSAIPREGARRLVVIIWLLLLGSFEVQRTWHLENWSEAAHFIREVYPESPILFHSGLRETECLACHEDKEFAQYLKAPLRTLDVTNKIALLSEIPSESYLVEQVKSLGRSDTLLYVGLPRIQNLTFERIEQNQKDLINTLKEKYDYLLHAQHTFGRVVVLSFLKKGVESARKD
jgi:hypothetical protein